MAAVGDDLLLTGRANMDGDSYDLVLELMLEDARQIAEGKGKQLEGIVSDTEMAFGLYAVELQNALTIDSDRRLTMSMQSALLTDGNVVLQLQEEERMAQHDHAVAVALSEGRDPPPMPPAAPAPAPETVPELDSAPKPDARQSSKRKVPETAPNRLAKRPRTEGRDSITMPPTPPPPPAPVPAPETVCEIASAHSGVAGKSTKRKELEIAPDRLAKRPKTDRVDLGDETEDDSIFESNQATKSESSSWAASRQPPPNHRPCTSCMESHPEPRLIRALCGHEYCHDCIKSLYTTAMRDETLFPPKCCQQAIPTEQHSQILGSKLVSLFYAKQIEFSTEDRTYCHNAECGAFIKPCDVGNCTSCAKRTCVSCKRIAHEDDCPQDTELQRVLEMAQQEGWRRCTKCNAMVELAHGCNHMT